MATFRWHFSARAVDRVRDHLMAETTSVRPPPPEFRPLWTLSGRSSSSGRTLSPFSSSQAASSTSENGRDLLHKVQATYSPIVGQGSVEQPCTASARARGSGKRRTLSRSVLRGELRVLCVMILVVVSPAPR